MLNLSNTFTGKDKIDFLTSEKAKSRNYFNYEIAIKEFANQNNFNRTLWSFLALELWQNNFIDK